MGRVAEATGRRYHLFDYDGDPDADRVIVIMGSGAEVASQTSEALNRRGQHTGVISVRLFRPFSAEALMKAIPLSIGQKHCGDGIAAKSRDRKANLCCSTLHRPFWSRDATLK